MAAISAAWLKRYHLIPLDWGPSAADRHAGRKPQLRLGHREPRFVHANWRDPHWLSQSTLSICVRDCHTFSDSANNPPNLSRPSNLRDPITLTAHLALDFSTWLRQRAEIIESPKFSREVRSGWDGQPLSELRWPQAGFYRRCMRLRSLPFELNPKGDGRK
jgi:hypothetical protein